MTPDQIPYIVHESMVARQERTIRRLWILCIIIFAAFVGSNMAWMYYESQFTDEVTVQGVSQDIDSGNGDAIVAGIGDIYGKSETESNNRD